jgi:hypothetical protein
MATMSRPIPIPISSEATNHSTDVFKKISPTPNPMSVHPPIAHEALFVELPVVILFVITFQGIKKDWQGL